ncbi:Metal-dependent hydrolase, endonuclease/exonuclease/phosphatase family [Flavobacteriaceae bacterium MAR_2010_188]|nr:Metal-dependent hydrolase, endonuclease/exonuclease/phosphatase family [Flavobacteriaceae bacterium MAR_2010_188]
MKNISILLMLITFATTAQELSVMTYNIKLDYPIEGENSWTNRKPMFIGQLNFYEPDIFGVQEAMPNQMKEMDSLLPNYGFVGVGRDDGQDLGEYSAIFYKKNKFKVLVSSTFWLSETPDKVSMGWDAACNRVCTYVKFEDLQNHSTFYVFNTHFDHIGVEARKNSSKLIIKKINEINVENLPVILTGDFNLEEDSESIKYIKSQLKDSKEISKAEPFGPIGTFNNFEFDKPVSRRLDYIFVNSRVTVQKYAVLSDSKDLHYPSDHLPVLVMLKLD